ncbi:MAG TPA: DUF6600 domain-containing protein [Thermoanaerobaculia bacterium]|nr:DUF6600 domain-containing protein [Thermoanaerobaculia bacterium]
MKTERLAWLALLAGGALACTVYTAPPPPPPFEAGGGAEVSAGAEVEVGGNVEVGVFYRELAPYGEWIERPGYGRVFLPSGVAAGWRPYVAGRWVNSDFGWTWVSEERWGWATYHYGRWYQDSEVGWVWVPGREWGPAWVSFQQGGGYIGWAPLPPSISFRAGFGLELGGVSLTAVIAPVHYCFVQERVFLQPQVATYIVPPARNVTIINNTTNITNISVVNNKVVNQSVNVQHFEQATGQRVQKYQIAAGANHATQVKGNQVSLYTPGAKPVAAGRSAKPQGAANAANATSPAVSKTQGSQTQTQDQKFQPAGQQGQNQLGQGGGGGQQGMSAADLRRKHDSEKQALDAQHAAERRKLEAAHQNERKAAGSGGTAAASGTAAGGGNAGNAAELRKRHDAELRALQEQHQKEQAELAARHKREQAAQQAAKSKEKEKKPPPRSLR